MRRLTAVWLGVATFATSTARADTITLEAALDRAAGRPAVEMAAEETRAVEAEARGARLPLYNPGLDVAVGPRLGGGATVLDLEVQLSQSIELGGKRRARRDAADARARGAHAALSLELLLARLETWRAYELALVARQRLAAAEDVEQLAVDVAEATKATQRAGAGTELEVNLTTSEVGRAKHDRLDAESAYDAALADLAASIGAGPAAQLEPTGDVATLVDLPWSEDDFVALAVRQRPEVEVARAGLAAARADTRVADAGAAPDLTLGLSYGFEQDTVVSSHVVLVSASISLPFRNKNQGARDAARARTRRAAIETRHQETEVEREARLAYAIDRRARDAVLGFDAEVTTGLHDNLELARRSWESGRLDYFELTEARRDLLANHLGYLDALAEGIEARYAALRAVGQDQP